MTNGIAEQRIIAGKRVYVHEDGFFVFPDLWIAAMAPQLAGENGIAELTERHWKVIRIMRAAYEERGAGPGLQGLSTTSGICLDELARLFPGNPAATAARIAGIPRPQECSR